MIFFFQNKQNLYFICKDVKKRYYFFAAPHKYTFLYIFACKTQFLANTILTHMLSVLFKKLLLLLECQSFLCFHNNSGLINSSMCLSIIKSIKKEKKYSETKTINASYCNAHKIVRSDFY